ncbi:hypothetical protein SAMN04487948_10840 [Halogranum amylolyticum]|uniref:PGF-CTERM protein n=1 Tax=Halogranum amylolyticum TaxID=660520 RepID=A0A1H8TQ64_9EURY|nr:hypothetical protein [Halogranum amylolyticum]SEO93027.1 hypothetical protein SAMN04487948_10840 [Halogranum amylolyticum]
MSHSTDEPRRATATDGVSRRRLLRAGSAAAAVAGVPALSGLAGAQSDGEDEEKDDIYTNGVLSNSTPKFGNSDFTGLYLLVEDPQNDPDTTGVSSCDVIESDDRIAAYNATISEKVDVGAESEAEETTLYIPAQDSTVETGNQYVVNSQTDCPGGHTSVKLEQVGSSSIETAATNGTGETTTVTDTAGTTDDGPVTDEPESETTEASSPGFSALTGVLGVGAAGLAALKRAGSGEDDQ